MDVAEPVQAGSIDVLYVGEAQDWAARAQVWMWRRGWRTESVRTPAQLRARLSTPPIPRCLLLDASRNSADGLELCSRLMRSVAFQRLPVVILAADGGVTERMCWEHQALFRVLKGPNAEADLAAAVFSILSYQDRLMGLIDAGDLRMDPRGGKVFHGGALIAELPAGPFAALAELVRASPDPVPDERLYAVFLARRPYQSRDRELVPRLTVRNYVYLLRRQLKVAAARLVRAPGGYAYRPPQPLPGL